MAAILSWGRWIKLTCHIISSVGHDKEFPYEAINFLSIKVKISQEFMHNDEIGCN